jgi:glucose-6-phosphate isomerase
MFSKCKNFSKLEALSRNPPDCTTLLTKERIEEFQSQNAGWKLFFATERVNGSILETLLDLAKERKVLDSMRAMQEGKIVNEIQGFESEKRAALHTAVRDFFQNPVSTKEAESARKEAYKEVEKLKALVQEMEEREITDLIQIGIGGSALGPKAIIHALFAYQKRPIRVHFLSNIDPDSAASLMREVNLEKTLVISVSKSGTTIETVVNEERLRKAFEKAHRNPKEHFLSVTGKNSPMDNSSKYLSIFYIWDSIGGRYSATSMVGGVVLSLSLGFDIYWKLLEGAHAMDLVARSSSGVENLPLLGALLGIWNRNFLHHASLALIPYAQSLRDLPSHIQQLDMESNGKQIDRKGEFLDFAAGTLLFGDVGTDCQHSFFQYLHQGMEIVPLELIGSIKSQYEEDFLFQETTSQEKLLSNLLGQMIALAMGQRSENPNRIFLGNRPSHLLITEKIDPYHLGALLAYYEHKVVFQGFLWGINSFDQEGVELGKKLSKRVQEEFRNKRSQEHKSQFPLAEAYLDQLKNLF